MFGPIIKLINRRACPHSVTVYSDFTKTVALSEEKCIYDAQHKGPHKDRLGNTWATNDNLRERLEWEGLK